MADYVSFQPNLPSFGGDYLSQGFAGALALPNYFQNVDRQGELWKYAQEMQPLDKRSKELSNEQMSLANQGLQYGLSGKQLEDNVNKFLLSDPAFTELAAGNRQAELSSTKAEHSRKAIEAQSDLAYDLAVQTKDLPEPIRRQIVDRVGGPLLSKELKEAIITAPVNYMDGYKTADYARKLGEINAQGMWGVKTAASGRDRPLPPMNMSQVEAELSKKVTTGTATPVEVAELNRIRASKYAAADVKGAQQTSIVIETLKKAGRQYTHPVTGEKVRFDRLPLETQQDLINRELNKPSGSGQPQTSKPVTLKSKTYGEEFTITPGGNR